MMKCELKDKQIRFERYEHLNITPILELISPNLSIRYNIDIKIESNSGKVMIEYGSIKLYLLPGEYLVNIVDKLTVMDEKTFKDKFNITKGV